MTGSEMSVVCAEFEPLPLPLPFPPPSPKFQKLYGLEPSPGVELSPEPLPGTADEAIWMLRLTALTMPSVTVLGSARGAPIATTLSPTLTFDELPNSMG